MPISTSISKDTQLCISISARPGNFGTRFQNFLYRELSLDFIYKAFAVIDLPAAIAGIRGLSIRGAAVSMPFKEKCIPFLDELDASAQVIQSVNTIVQTQGRLKGYNTDYGAVVQLLRARLSSRELSPSSDFILRGSGGMAKAVIAALRDCRFTDGTIVSRNPETGNSLAALYGYAWKPESALPDLHAKLLVNVTPIGMAASSPSAISDPPDPIPFSESQILAADLIFDVVAVPPETALIRLAKKHSKPTLSGADVIVLQAVEQFVLYTGVRPDDTLIARAARHALQNPS